MFLLVLTHLSCPGQSPESHKMVVVVVVVVVVGALVSKNWAHALGHDNCDNMPRGTCRQRATIIDDQFIDDCASSYYHDLSEISFLGLSCVRQNSISIFRPDSLTADFTMSVHHNSDKCYMVCH